MGLGEMQWAGMTDVVRGGGGGLRVQGRKRGLQAQGAGWAGLAAEHRMATRARPAPCTEAAPASSQPHSGGHQLPLDCTAPKLPKGSPLLRPLVRKPSGRTSASVEAGTGCIAADEPPPLIRVGISGAACRQ